MDNGRTGWVRDEKIFTKANVGTSKLLWKIKLESTPRAMHNLFAPLIAERVNTAAGVKELGVVAGVSDDLFGIDIATGTQLWHRKFDNLLTNTGPSNDTLCPGRPDGGADDGADVAGRLHDLRRLVGRPAASGEPR